MTDLFSLKKQIKTPLLIRLCRTPERFRKDVFAILCPVLNSRKVLLIENGVFIPVLSPGKYLKTLKQPYRKLQRMLPQDSKRLLRRKPGIESWNLFFSGDEFYRDLLRDIRQAERRIWIEVYILGNDSIGHQLLSDLKIRAGDELDVRLIVDGIGSLWLRGKELSDLRKKGVRVHRFSPLKPSFYFLSGINRRNHRKLMIVDDCCYLGGMNIECKQSVACSGSKAWKDTMIRLEGRVTEQLSESFLRIWDVAGGQAFRTVLKRSRKKKSIQSFQILEGIPTVPRIRSRLVFLRLMRKVKKRVLIRSAYFVPGPFLIRRLKRLARRGVDVRVLLNGRSDVPAAMWAGRALYSFLLKSGIRIYERKGRFSHAKVTVLDGKYSLLGSSNMDYRSFLHNLEIDLFFTDRKLSAQLEGEFYRELEHAEEITLADQRNRPLQKKLLEWFFYLFRYWL